LIVIPGKSIPDLSKTSITHDQQKFAQACISWRSPAQPSLLVFWKNQDQSVFSRAWPNLDHPSQLQTGPARLCPANFKYHFSLAGLILMNTFIHQNDKVTDRERQYKQQTDYIHSNSIITTEQLTIK